MQVEMTESQVYDKNGLFHAIVKKSAIFAGRYAVLPRGAVDLNAGNVISGLDIPKEKYPIVACMPPGSQLDPDRTGWEHFYFRLLFLCNSGFTGDSKVKFNDPNTNASTHAESLDWNDMKNAALAFIAALQNIRPARLEGKFTIFQQAPVRFTRITAAQNDKLSGVLMSFEGRLAVDCEFTDINESEILLEFPEHTSHLH